VDNLESSSASLFIIGFFSADQSVMAAGETSQSFYLPGKVSVNPPAFPSPTLNATHQRPSVNQPTLKFASLSQIIPWPRDFFCELTLRMILTISPFMFPH